MRIPRALREKLKLPAKKSKYKNVKTTVDGIKFDSKKESERYKVLKILQEQGKIAELKRQVPFFFTFVEESGKITLKRQYRADFTYTKDGELVVEDVKSAHTKTLAPYKQKKKWMKQKYGTTILET